MDRQLQETLQFVNKQGVEKAEVGIILGTGLGGLVEKITIINEISYDKIPHFPVSTVESHVGKLIYGKIGNKTVIAMQGRFHYYEGYDMKQIAYPVRLLKHLGIKNLLISNAAGAVNLDFKKSELMLITDHINMFPSNPLIGKNNNEEGPRFPDMSCTYNKKLNNLIEEIAQEKNITIKKGIYVSVPGPNLETRAEYKMLKLLGADAVGMSTVPEVIAAAHLGLSCCAISVLTDECDPNNLAPVAIEEILEAAAIAEPQLTSIYTELIHQL